nr:phage integrase Arm DNA-binding domain-containing protein [Citrobacter freundii]
MAKRPVRYDANLPRNLTYRKRDRLYSWIGPYISIHFLSLNP